MDIVTLMENVEMLTSSDVKRWCDEDPIHRPLLLEALDNGLEYFIEYGDGTDHFDLIKKWKLEHAPCVMTDPDILLLNNRITIEGDTFKKWYYSIWPPEDTVESHMSRDLKIAVQCSRDLYRDGDLSEKSATEQNKKIKEWIRKNHPEIKDGNKRHDRLKLIVSHG